MPEIVPAVNAVLLNGVCVVGFDSGLNTVFKSGRIMDGLQKDRQLIKELGGPTKVAERLGYGKGGPQRVANWARRGIPPGVKVAHPNLFLLPTAPQVAVIQGAMDASQLAA